MEEIRWAISEEPTREIPVQYICFIIPFNNRGNENDDNLVVRIPFRGAFGYEKYYTKPKNIFQAWEMAKVEYNKVKGGFWQSSKLYHNKPLANSGSQKIDAPQVIEKPDLLGR